MVRTRHVSTRRPEPAVTGRGTRFPARATAVVAAALLGVLPAVGSGPAAWADPPSDDDVAAAHAAVDAAQLDVTGAQERLDAIRAELAEAEVVVQTAAEDYAEAREGVRAAREEADDAAARAERASKAQAEARSALADAYRTTARAGDPSPLAVVAGAHDVDDVVAGGAAQRAVDRKNSRAVTTQADLRAAAENADARWDAARAALAEAKKQARAAFDAAQEAADALAARTAAAEDERDRLYARLAQLRSTSVELEREREQARQAEAERAREREAQEATVAAAAASEAEDATEERAARPAAEDSDDSADEPRDRPAPEPEQTREAAPAPDPEPEQTREPTREPAPNPAPDPAPKPEPPPVSGVEQGAAAQGRAAVAWARSKIGIAYQWGGTGNPGYDCSGLTSGAWNDAGVWITRTSRSQYLSVGKVSYDQMRPGDLIFYANDTSDPSSIRHVAMYSGNGMMVEAPRPGVAVRETPVRWTDAMPLAGRP